MNVVLIGGPDRETAVNIIYAACRQCYSPGFVGSDYPFENVSKFKKKELIQRVVNSGHMSTIEHVAFTFAIENVSRGLQQQITRHRLANFSIQSTRYNNVENMGVYKAPSIKKNEAISKEYDDFVKTAAGFYKHLIDNGIPKEDARDVLPIALNSNIVMTMNCRELIHFFELRLCMKAQKEIRDLAKEMLKLCQERLPEVFENIGPKCKQIGYCNEGNRSCGLMPLKEDVFRVYSEHKSSN